MPTTPPFDPTDPLRARRQETRRRLLRTEEQEDFGTPGMGLTLTDLNAARHHLGNLTTHLSVVRGEVDARLVVPLEDRVVDAVRGFLLPAAEDVARQLRRVKGPVPSRGP